jgi:hypothetical protein
LARKLRSPLEAMYAKVTLVDMKTTALIAVNRVSKLPAPRPPKT